MASERHSLTRSRVCAQEWHLKGIHSHIYWQTSMHIPQQKIIIAKRSTHQTWCLPLLVLFLSNVVMGDGQEAWHLLLRTAPRQRPSPRTILTENICKCVQHILQHFQQLSRFLHGAESAHNNGIVKTFPHTSIPTHPCTLIKKEREKQRAKRSTDQTWCLRLLVLFLSTLVVGGGQEAWHLMTAPRRRPSRLGQYWQKTFADVFNKYSNIARQKSHF